MFRFLSRTVSFRRWDGPHPRPSPFVNRLADVHVHTSTFLRVRGVVRYSIYSLGPKYLSSSPVTLGIPASNTLQRFWNVPDLLSGARALYVEGLNCLMADWSVYTEEKPKHQQYDTSFPLPLTLSTRL